MNPVQLISHLKYERMPWKNGLGMTTQMLLFPEGSDFSRSDFSWRLSSAEIRASNPFSKFAGYDRLLAVIEGKGLRLNDSLMLPFQPLQFAGESEIFCDLIESRVVDLGLIYRRDMIQASLKFGEIEVSSSLELELAAGIHLIGSFEVGLEVNGIIGAASDTFQIAGPLQANLRLSRDSTKSKETEKLNSSARHFHFHIQERELSSAP
jgi:environmental stress-induced protein Ves